VKGGENGMARNRGSLQRPIILTWEHGTMGRISRMLKINNKDTVCEKPPAVNMEELVRALEANPNLARIVKIWPNLSAPVQHAILILLDTAK
jgi:hypothetical protein